MDETFKCVADHLYRRQYQTAGGEWRTKYYAIFTDWKGKRRKIAVGDDEKTARASLTIWLADNHKRVDFDLQKEKVREHSNRITFSKWGELYFSEMVNPNKRSIAWEQIMFRKLDSYFGGMFLDDIDESAIDDYRDQRLRSPVTKHKKPVKGTRMAYSSVNRELAILRLLLRLAKRKKRIKAVPEFSLASEKPLKRKRVASDEEIQAVLSHLTRRWQRPVIGLLETAMRVNELLRLTWDKVDEKGGFIRLDAADVKEKAPRIIPISPALGVIFGELRAEQRQAKVKDLSQHVFTYHGAPIRTIRKGFELARKKAGIKDLHIHDLRHTAITRWAMAGIPTGAIMAASGHHSLEMHNGYVNVNENHLKEAFKVFPSRSQEISNQQDQSVNS